VVLHLYYNFVRIHWEIGDIVALIKAREAEKRMIRGTYKKRRITADRQAP
jgi:hypothetical protein